MDTLSYLFSGFQTALTFQNIGAAAIGAILGIIVGAMPGIGSLVGVALLLPLTYAFNPTTAIIMLGAIYYANMFGGAFSSILINVPGDAPAIMTALDGYPLARKGKPGKALMVANMSSFLGGLLGMIVLTFFGPALAQFGLKFGPAEMTTLMLVALSSISWLIEGNVMKGLAVTCIGILIATIGISTNTGEARYTFGVLHLLSGVNFIPLVVGFIGMAQVFNLLGQQERGNDLVVKKLSIADCKLNKEDFSRMGAPVVRSGLLGSVIGFIPGAGATMASIVSYTIQKKSKRNKEKLGTGAIEGIAASEAANNGKRNHGGSSGRFDDVGTSAGTPTVYGFSGFCLGTDFLPLCVKYHCAFTGSAYDSADYEGYLYSQSNPDSYHYGDLLCGRLCLHHLHVGCSDYDYRRNHGIHFPEIWVFRISHAAGYHSLCYL